MEVVTQCERNNLIVTLLVFGFNWICRVIAS